MKTKTQDIKKERKLHAKRQAEEREERKKRKICYACDEKVAIVNGKPANMCQKHLDADRQRKAASRMTPIYWFDDWKVVSYWDVKDPRVQIDGRPALPLAIRNGQGGNLTLYRVKR
jgi:hypothetical protein